MSGVDGACAILALTSALLALAVLIHWRSRARERAGYLAERERWQLRLADEGSARERTERDYRELLDCAGVGVVRCTAAGEIRTLNARAVELLGYESADDVMQLNMRTLYVEPARRDVTVRRILRERTFRNLDIRLRRRDGSVLYALMNGHVLDGEGSEPLIETVMIDVGELHAARERQLRLEDELRLAQKLQAIGSLAAGIAHEINTPLQFVSDSSRALRRCVRDLETAAREYRECATALRADSRDQDALDDIEELEESIDTDRLETRTRSALERIDEGVERVTRIVRAMKEFAHPDSQGCVQADLNHALEVTLEVCRNEYKQVADVETDFGELPPLSCQIGDLNQAFVNLIVNAAHAIEKAQAGRPGKGRIRIATSAEASAVVVTITDSGCGIPESVRHRIFDPYFTTKEVGKGTGQGLAQVHAVVVNRHGGEISVQSTVGSGTCFTVRLPLERLPKDSQRNERSEMYGRAS